MRRCTALVAAALLPCFLALPACSRKAGPEGVDLVPLAARELTMGLSLREARGRSDFRHYCAICHGDLGAGDGFNSFNLDPKPRDLKEAYRQEGKQMVEKAIREGTAALGRSPQSPPWGRTLSADTIDRIVLFIGALDRIQRPEPAAPKPGESR